MNISIVSKYIPFPVCIMLITMSVSLNFNTILKCKAFHLCSKFIRHAYIRFVWLTNVSYNDTYKLIKTDIFKSRRKRKADLCDRFDWNKIIPYTLHTNQTNTNYSPSRHKAKTKRLMSFTNTIISLIFFFYFFFIDI